VEIPRPLGTFPPAGSSTPRAFSGGTGVPSPFGGVRGHTEFGTAVAPVPRGGHGTLGSFFGRTPSRHGERGYHPVPYYAGPAYAPGYYPYPSNYYYGCPYDIYPPGYFYPVPEPEIVVVPEPYYLAVPDGGGQVEAVTLDDVIADIEESWETGKLALLMRHVRSDTSIQVYRDGDWIDTLSRTQFAQKTEQAFRDYDTVSMTFERPEMLGDDETGAPRARARGTHVYRTRDGEERRVHVTYAFRRYGRSWYVVGLDYEPTPRQNAAAPEIAPSAPAVLSESLIPPAASVAAPAGKLALVSAPPVRVRDLMNAHQPRPLATVKWLRGDARTVYTLQAMRGVVPGTMAWALYRKGDRRPAETGIVDVSALPLNGWIAVRPRGPQLITLASLAPARSRLALLATHTFPEASLALVPAKPPAKAAHSAKSGRRTSHLRKRRARRA
jgi:hypothetical protein